MKRVCIIVLCVCIVLSLFACKPLLPAEYARLNAKAEGVFSTDYLENEGYEAAYLDFAYRFFRTIDGAETKNFCLSPLSAYMAFSLCFYGSGGSTAEEFERTFGLDKKEAAEYCSSLYAYFMQRKYADEQTKVCFANSVWIDSEIASYVKEEYLTGATEHFDAAVYQCDFSDQGTVKAINNWCAENTDDMIDKIIDRLEEYQILALINALLVEAAWADPYTRTVEDSFMCGDASVVTAEYLPRTIKRCYITEDAKAFKMPLADGFSFLGILPEEGVSLSDYVASLTAEKVSSLLAAESSEYDVYTRIPKFTLDYEIELDDTMKEMGIPTAYDPIRADFSLLAEIPGKNVYIGTAKQKTHFELDEKGIKAAAITYIGMKATNAMPVERKKINIYLDRPFLYLLVDDRTGLPLFIGRINSLGK